jgi:hypothetical protein
MTLESAPKNTSFNAKGKASSSTSASSHLKKAGQEELNQLKELLKLLTSRETEFESKKDQGIQMKKLQRQLWKQLVKMQEPKIDADEFVKTFNSQGQLPDEFDVKDGKDKEKVKKLLKIMRRYVGDLEKQQKAKKMQTIKKVDIPSLLKRIPKHGDKLADFFESNKKNVLEITRLEVWLWNTYLKDFPDYKKDEIDPLFKDETDKANLEDLFRAIRVHSHHLMQTAAGAVKLAVETYYSRKGQHAEDFIESISDFGDDDDDDDD